MAGPIIVGILYSVVVIILCFFKPAAGRYFIGFFFIAMGIGVNVTFTIASPTFVADYGMDAWLPLYRTLTEAVIAPVPRLFAVLLIIFEVTTGMLVLAKGRWVKAGLIGTIAFVLMLAPIHPAQIAWAVSAAGPAYLLSKTFEGSFLDAVRRRKRGGRR